MICVSWLYFVCALFYRPIENSAFLAYGQQLYLQGFQTASSFIVNLESFKTLRSHNSYHIPGDPISA